MLEECDKIYSILLKEVAKHHSCPFFSRGINAQHLTRYSVGINQ